MRLFIGSTYQDTITPPSSTYEAEADALFARFTNTYGDTEKDLINTLIIDLKDGGIWDKLKVFYIGALSGKEEQLLNWKNSSYNLTTIQGDVTQVPYKGITPQNGSYDTGFDTSTLDINGTFISFKTYLDYSIPYSDYYFGSGSVYLRCKPIFVSTTTRGYAINLFSAPANFALKTGEKLNDTVCLNWDGTNYNAYLKGALNSSQAPVQALVLPTGTLKLGGVLSLRKQTSPTQIQHLAIGDALTDTEAKLLTNLIDAFVATQEALDVDYIQQTGYKVYQPGRYYADWNGTNCVWFDMKNMYYSNDKGVTITNSASIPTAGTFPQMARIFDDGKIIFAMSDNKIYKTDYTLVFTEMTPTKNGSTYTLHTPVDANYPGEYFKWLGIRNAQYLADGTEIFVWSNYGNVWGGANPLIVWYSFGSEIKVAYELGQNHFYTDTGSFVPDVGGTLLGDATEDIYSRHNHAVQQRPDNKNIFYWSGGDYDRPAYEGVRAFSEAVWLQLDYDQTLDTFTRTKLLEKSVTTKWKCTSLEMPNDGYIYYTSDLIIDGTNQDEVGIFRCLYADIGDDTTGKQELVYYPNDDTKPMNHCLYDGTTLIGGYAAGSGGIGQFGSANVIISRDGANTFLEETMNIAGNIYFFSVQEIETDKFKLDYMPIYSYQSAFSIILDFN